MKAINHIVVSLVLIVLLALGAMGFADKTEELVRRGAPAATPDSSPVDNDHAQPAEPDGAQAQPATPSVPDPGPVNEHLGHNAP